MILEIPKERFPILLEEGLTIVYKKEIKRAHFWPQGRCNLKRDESAALKEYMKTRDVDKPEKVEKLEPVMRNGFEPVLKDLDPNNIADLPIGTYDLDQNECSSNQRCCWE